MPHFPLRTAVCALFFCSAIPFSAVALEDAPPPSVIASAWAESDIEAARRNGIIPPEPGLGTDYTRPITRGQFAHLTVSLVAAAGQTDVPALAAHYGLDPAPSGEAVARPSDGDGTDGHDADVFPASAPTENSDADEPLPQGTSGEQTTGASPDAPPALTVSPSSFTDTDSLYTELAARLGIVQGENGLFRPDDPVERCEAAAMLQRCMAVLGRGEANVLPQAYTDAYAMPRWAVEPIKFVSGRTTPDGQPLMGGADGLFDPSGHFTIEQAIVSAGRCYDSLPVEGVAAGWRDAPGYDSVTITMSFGGDCTFGRGATFSYSGSFDEKYDTVRDPAYFFSGIPEFHTDDLTMVNFEGTLTDAKRAANKTFVFKGRPAYAKILEAGSIDVVSVANNHAKDYLQQGFDDTIRHLSPYVAVSGYERMPVLTVKGVRVGFVSHVGWSFDEAQKRFISGAVRELRAAGAELIVFNYHWGIERDYHSNATQRAIAHYAIDCGADLVIGHHPHVVQEVETYRGKQIAYSLGNLVFGGNHNPSDKNCLIFQQSFTLDLYTRAVTGASYRAIPYRISSVNSRNDYHPVPA